MSKMNKRCFCPGDGGHWIDSEPCSEHDSRSGHMIGRVFLWAGFVLIFLLLFSGFWAECTVTDPEYFFSR